MMTRGVKSDTTLEKAFGSIQPLSYFPILNRATAPFPTNASAGMLPDPKAAKRRPLREFGRVVAISTRNRKGHP